jgi:hypothetical protein
MDFTFYFLFYDIFPLLCRLVFFLVSSVGITSEKRGPRGGIVDLSNNCITRIIDFVRPETQYEPTGYICMYNVTVHSVGDRNTGSLLPWNTKLKGSTIQPALNTYM